MEVEGLQHLPVASSTCFSCLLTCTLCTGLCPACHLCLCPHPVQQAPPCQHLHPTFMPPSTQPWSFDPFCPSCFSFETIMCEIGIAAQIVQMLIPEYEYIILRVLKMSQKRTSPLLVDKKQQRASLVREGQMRWAPPPPWLQQKDMCPHCHCHSACRVSPKSLF